MTQWVTHHVADDIVKQRAITQQNFGIASAPQKKRTKTDDDRLKAQIIASKTTDYLQKIEVHLNSILSNSSPPIGVLKFDSTLPAVADLADSFVEYWTTHKDAELSAMVFAASQGMPASWSPMRRGKPS